jgi:diguanylate cyclase (GGDEF)-like protein
MSDPYRSVASAKLGAGSAGAAESVHLVGLALQSTLSPSLVIGRLCSTVSALLRADRCVVMEGSDPSDPLFSLVKEAFTRKEAVQAEGARSILCAPLFHETHPEGAIVVERPLNSPFGEPELKFLATVAPQAALAIQRARIYDRATSDGLTGLPNRQRFTVELEDAVLAGGSISLLLADFDHFKDKNDVYGRAVGDRILAEFGALLHGRLPAAISTARTGEDGFGALLPGIDAARARDFAEDLRKAVNDRIFDEPHEGIHLTVSVGVAEFKQGEMASSLFARAADALAAAKRGGRNRVEAAR